MSNVAFEDRVKGALLGAAIGAELSYGRVAHPENFQDVRGPADLLTARLEPAGDFREQDRSQWGTRVTPFVDVAVKAYLRKKGRITPEDFAGVFVDDDGIATPAFFFDAAHSTQEVLKEGMHPRLSGLGAAPCGLMSAAMPAVGIFHFADPERAYLDGVEIAAVVQPRQGAEWAGLCAAAVAAAFQPDASDASIERAVLNVAFANNKDTFYDLSEHLAGGFWRGGDEAGREQRFLDWWFHHGGRVPESRHAQWVAHDPIRYVLPALWYHGEPEKMMRLLVACPPTGWSAAALGGHAVPAVLAGTIAGALHGADAFPRAWRRWAGPVARPWFKLLGVLRRRAEEERRIVAMVKALARPRRGKGSQLHDRIKGALLAGAIGNAMGSPVEGRMYPQIDAEYPDGVTTILQPERLESEDDNQMAMLLVETYLERDGAPVTADHFARTWRERLNRRHFFPLCMGNAYDMIRRGWDPRIIGHWSVVTGSTVMCMEPVGIYHLADPQWAAIDATAVSYMYQRGLDVTAAAMLAATVSEVLRSDATVDSVLQAALDVAPREPMRTFDKRPFRSVYAYLRKCLDVADKYDDVLAARRELYDKCLLYHCIDPLELWGLSLAMFKIAAGDVRQAAIGGTNIGRDSDTIAGRAAMLSGALNGTRGVPAEWIALFSQSSMERIDRNAARLAELVGVAKLGRMKCRLAAWRR